MGLVILPPLQIRLGLILMLLVKVAQIALRAMKAVPDSQARETSSFTNIHQGAAEAYIDFIDLLQEAIERQIDNDRAAKSLLWQLAYENANKDCRTIIGPL